MFLKSNTAVFPLPEPVFLVAVFGSKEVLLFHELKNDGCFQLIKISLITISGLYIHKIESPKAERRISE